VAYDVNKRPAEWVRTQARQREARIWILVAVALVLTLLTLWVSLGLHQGGVAVALVGAMLVLSRITDRESTTALRWMRGARAEERVGEELNKLRGHGFTVMHDIEQFGEGNIDHLASGPSGVYLVETKYRRYRSPEDLRKAKRQAAKLKNELGVWVTPVICLAMPSDRGPYRHDGVWILRCGCLVEWVQAQRNKPPEFGRLAAFADRL
jgi:hypothetical protein